MTATTTASARAGCSYAEALLALHGDAQLDSSAGGVLRGHLGRCASCRALAAALADGDDDDAELPVVPSDAYAIDREIARGGMGRILAAHDRRVGRPVAVKELLDRDPVLIARFEREARLTARLQHPGIVPIYEVGRWPDGTRFYAMKLIDGRTLRDALQAAGDLDERLALVPIVRAACDAIGFAHGRHIIHRDLTPTNLLVGSCGETIVIDWGLAKDLSAEVPCDDPAASARLTREGSIIGTAAYMPPEQASGLPVDERADVYALGAILYHLVAGAPPYRGDGPAPSPAAVLRAIRTGPPRALHLLVPAAPRPLCSLIARAMAHDPGARYPSIAALAAELDRFLAGGRVAAHVYARREVARAWLGRNRALLLTSLVSCAAGALASAGLFALA